MRLIPQADPVVEKRGFSTAMVLQKIQSATEAIRSSDLDFSPTEVATLQQLGDKLSDPSDDHSIQILPTESDLLCRKLARRSASIDVLDLIRTMALTQSGVQAMQPHGDKLIDVALHAMENEAASLGQKRVGCELASDLIAAVLPPPGGPPADHRITPPSIQYTPIDDTPSSAGADRAPARGASGGAAGGGGGDPTDPAPLERAQAAVRLAEAANGIFTAFVDDDGAVKDAKLAVAAARVLGTVAWWVGRGQPKELPTEASAGGVESKEAVDAAMVVVKAASGVLERLWGGEEGGEGHAALVDQLLLAVGTASHWVPGAAEGATERELFMALLESMAGGGEDASNEQDEIVDGTQSELVSGPATDVDGGDNGSAGSLARRLARLAREVINVLEAYSQSVEMAIDSALEALAMAAPGTGSGATSASIDKRDTTAGASTLAPNRDSSDGQRTISEERVRQRAAPGPAADPAWTFRHEQRLRREMGLDILGASNVATSDALVSAIGVQPASGAGAGFATGRQRDEVEDEDEDPQRDFDEARQQVALSLHEERERQEAVQEVGRKFIENARTAAEGVPRLLFGVHGAGGQVTEASTALTAESLPASASCAVDSRERRDSQQRVGGLSRLGGDCGIAGGAKFVHKKLGLFLKTPGDSHVIYGSDVMAAKVMKLEAKAAGWVHAMDSVHANGALTTVVDVPYDRPDGSGQGVQRVQVQAKLDIGEGTLRYGSSNAGCTIHQDSKQEEDVVGPLAAHFWLAPVRQQLCTKVVLHGYEESCIGGGGTGGAGGVESGSAFNWLSLVKSRRVDMSEIEEAYIPTDLSDDSIDTLVLQSGASLAPDVTTRGDPHSTVVARPQRVTIIGGKVVSPVPGLVTHALPFDVEVHQLASGSRIVLDTHRLLMPDQHWIRWMNRSQESLPRVWLVWPPAGDGACALVSGRLGRHVSWPSRPTMERRLAADVQAWASSVGPIESTDEFVVASKHRGAGLILLRSVEGASEAVLIVVSCPAWYFGKNPYLCCMLPPEAARVASQLKGEDGAPLPRVSPDCEMRQGSDATRAQKQTDLLRVTSALSSPSRLQAVHAELLELTRRQTKASSECQTGTSSHVALPRRLELRSMAKQILKKYGLCLRHVGLIAATGKTSGLDSLSLEVLLACGLPSAVSPAGQALRTAIASALAVATAIIGSDDERTSVDLRRTVEAVCVASRAFAAKGIVLPVDGVSLAAIVGSEIPCSARPGDVSGPADSIYGEFLHTIATGAVGVSTAIAHGHVSRSTDGGMDLEAGKRRIAALLRELAHIQRVAGSGEARLLSQLAGIGTHGGHLRSLALRCIARQGSLCMTVSPSGRDTSPCRKSLTSYVNIGSQLSSLSCHASALGQFEWIKETSRLTPTDLFVVHGFIAQCLQSLGRYGEALELYKECKASEARVLGVEHPKYLGTLDNMAGCLDGMGLWNEALVLFEECRDTKTRVFGPTHPSYLTTLGNMAGCLQSAGRNEKALELYEECKASMIGVLGPDHPDILDTISDMAGCLDSLGRAAAALDLYAVCKTGFARSLGTKHPRYLNTLGNMANSVFNTGDMEKSLELFQECIDPLAHVLGKRHPHYLVRLLNMANCLRSMGRYGEALSLCVECKAPMAEVLGEEHPHFLHALVVMASCLEQLDRRQEALEIYIQCKTSQAKVLGTQHPLYLSTLGNVASCLDCLNRPKEALEAYQQCLSSVAPVLGRDHSTYLTAFSGMANCLQRLSRFGEALEVYRQCTASMSRVLGAMHPHYLLTLGNMAGCLLSVGRREEALHLYQQCMTSQASVFGTQHPEFLRTLENVANCLESMGRHQEALVLRCQASSL